MPGRRVGIASLFPLHTRVDASGANRRCPIGNHPVFSVDLNFPRQTRHPTRLRPMACWAHFEFTRINIELVVLSKKIEERCVLCAFASMGSARSLCCGFV